MDRETGHELGTDIGADTIERLERRLEVVVSIQSQIKMRQGWIGFGVVLQCP